MGPGRASGGTGPGQRRRSAPSSHITQRIYYKWSRFFSRNTDKTESRLQQDVHPPPRPEPTVRTSAWRDITSKLQTAEVDVKLPQSRGNGSPPTSDFCITTKSVEWSVRADVAKRSFLFSGRPTHTCRWIAPRWCEGVSMFTGHPVFAWLQTSNSPAAGAPLNWVSVLWLNVWTQTVWSDTRTSQETKTSKSVPSLRGNRRRYHLQSDMEGTERHTDQPC